MIDKSVACRRLLAHPYVLASMRRMLGRDAIPTWDSMVFKQAGPGAVVPWHRDQNRGDLPVGDIAAVNVDVYCRAVGLPCAACAVLAGIVGVRSR